MAGVVVCIAILTFGFDLDSYRNGLGTQLDKLIQIRNDDGSVRPTGTRGPLVDFLILAIPPAAAVITTITHVFNLWLAGRVVRFSGLLKRPWPDLPSITFPPLAAAALALAAIGSFFGGLPGIMSGAIAAALLMAYSILGFAVLHVVTHAVRARAFVLGGVYGAVIFFGWPVLALCLLGLGETAFGIRARFGQRPSPPRPI
ncbi:MAG: DUF2232 domain-containing protein [Pseudolabrys sp.]|nr:DUF2232 domain-containing protein [Pseudolabrys sp.]